MTVNIDDYKTKGDYYDAWYRDFYDTCHINRKKISALNKMNHDQLLDIIDELYQANEHLWNHLKHILAHMPNRDYLTIAEANRRAKDERSIPRRPRKTPPHPRDYWPRSSTQATKKTDDDSFWDWINPFADF